MQANLIALPRAIAQARTMKGPLLFTDAADATSSGATGDSNLIVKALHAAGYPGRVLAQIVDPGAAAAAHKAGVGATIDVTLGGAVDPDRFPPMPVRAEVALLSDGRARLETMGTPLEAGPTAVLRFDNFTIVVFSRSVSLFDRALYYANGCNPRDFDLIVLKSPHAEFHMYDAWVEKNFNIDVPGATSANLPTLGHTICARPMYPLDEGATFTPEAKLYQRNPA
jgi:microcystin degradation protein MlrC